MFSDVFTKSIGAEAYLRVTVKMGRSMWSADHAFRSVLASHLTETTRLTVPAFLHEPDQVLHEEHASFELVDPEMDKETHSQFTSFATQIHFGNLTADRFK